MKKGCFIALGVLVSLAIIGIGTIYYLASQYEKRPKKPGEAEVWAAEDLIRSYKDKEGFGNTPEAITFAEDFARDLRVSRQMLFTEGKPDAASLSDGRFLTYCSVREDSVALLIHVPELRRYTKDAKLTLEELTWTLASQAISEKFPEATKMALGIKGALDYSSIVTGSVNKEDPLKGLTTRHSLTSTEPFWPYFLPPVNPGQKDLSESSTGKPSESGSAPSEQH